MPQPDPIFALNWGTAPPPAGSPARPAAPAPAPPPDRDWRAAADRQMDANRARYGQSMPQYYGPDQFKAGGWELFVAEHPRALSVIQWKRDTGRLTAADRPACEHHFGRDTAARLFGEEPPARPDPPDDWSGEPDDDDPGRPELCPRPSRAPQATLF